jgi:uncharacterized protein YndB with AHSA1/START domain
MGNQLTIQARIAAPVALVYRALTDAAALRTWLAEHAEIDLTAGRYAFWGRYTPQGVSSRQRLLATEPDRLLRFAWVLDGKETTAEFQLLRGGGDSTLLTINQSGVPGMDDMMGQTGRRDGLHSLHTFWGLAVARLAEYAEGRELTPPCDFSHARRDEIHIGLTIAASPERVFASLIEPAQIDRWFGGAAEVEPRVGGRISLFGGEPADTILELAPNRTLAYSGRTADATTVVR